MLSLFPQKHAPFFLITGVTRRTNHPHSLKAPALKMYAALRGERGAAKGNVEWITNHTEQHVGARSPPYTKILLAVCSITVTHTSNLNNRSST